MKYVKFSMIATSLLAAVLSLAYDLLSLGGQGIMVLSFCLIPAALGAYGTFVKKALPRWAAIVSAVSFLLVAMKTSGGPEGSDLENIMMAGALGLILAVVVAIKPDRAPEAA